MASSTAVIIGLRHHWSLRSVRSGICALVLAGASDSCVILQRPRCLVRDRDAARGQAAVMGAGRCAHAMSTNLFQLVTACRIRAPIQHVRLATLPANGLVARAA